MAEASTLPGCFVESALPTRAEYEASLRLSNAERSELEASARAAQCCALESSPALAPGGSSTDKRSCPQLHATSSSPEWQCDMRRQTSRRRSDTRRNIMIKPGGSIQPQEINRQLANAFGPIVKATTQNPTDSPEKSDPPITDSPSFRTRQLMDILENLPSAAYEDSEDDTASPMGPTQPFRRRRGSQTDVEVSSVSVLSLAGAIGCDGNTR